MCEFGISRSRLFDGIMRTASTRSAVFSKEKFAAFTKTHLEISHSTVVRSIGGLIFWYTRDLESRRRCLHMGVVYLTTVYLISWPCSDSRDVIVPFDDNYDQLRP